MNDSLHGDPASSPQVKNMLSKLLINSDQKVTWTDKFKELIHLFGISQTGAQAKEQSRFGTLREIALKHIRSKVSIQPFIKAVGALVTDTTQLSDKKFTQSLTKSEFSFIREIIKTRTKSFTENLTEFREGASSITISQIGSSTQFSESLDRVSKVRVSVAQIKKGLKSLIVDRRGELFGKSIKEVLGKDSQNKHKIQSFTKDSRAAQGDKANLRAQTIAAYSPSLLLGAMRVLQNNGDPIAAIGNPTSDDVQVISAYILRQQDTKQHCASDAYSIVISEFCLNFALYQSKRSETG